MNKKATVIANVIYIVLAVGFSITMILVVQSYANGANQWSDFYSKEISKIIDLSPPGTTVTLDIHKTTQIARSKRISRFEEIFTFDNPNNEVCVKLSRGQKTCYPFYNNVDIVEPTIVYGDPINLLSFRIQEAAK